MSLFVFQEFERDESPENFWGIMALDTVGSVTALVASAFVAWEVLPFSDKPIDRLQSLNGCYEGQGLPDFMRPRVHWTFRVNEGRIFDRARNEVSSIRLHYIKSGRTVVTFSPGIRISEDEHKSSVVERGDTGTGQAFLNGSRAKIALADDWGDLMQTTSCG